MNTLEYYKKIKVHVKYTPQPTRSLRNVFSDWYAYRINEDMLVTKKELQTLKNMEIIVPNFEVIIKC